MSKIDDLINESLSKEDEALLEHYGNEPGYFSQAMALFRGQLGWVMWFVGIVQLLFFLGAIYALVQVFTVDQVMDALRWGVVTVVLVQLSTFLRGFMGAHFEANRVLRQIARLELRLVASRTES
ncbi:DUF6768 family protein [Wenzhouxiangella sp. EGI_FJ10409]|uniref:DUF6768 family protein n=1 Tax=Wenzhouxiangella sp. EGI_FJ10409 TaxID=3243767 RepID=UPI0035DB0210